MRCGLEKAGDGPLPEPLRAYVRLLLALSARPCIGGVVECAPTLAPARTALLAPSSANGDVCHASAAPMPSTPTGEMHGAKAAD